MRVNVLQARESQTRISKQNKGSRAMTARLTAKAAPPRLMLRLCLATALFASPLATVAAQSPTELTETQRTLLETQLKERYNCDLEKILFAREFDLAGERKLEGRARCVDQREIDFSQQSDNARFDLQICQPTVC